MSASYSHIVVGAGALGTAAAYWLAKGGAERVLVLEQFEMGHTRGASEDHSRIIRHIYHSPVYSALTAAAYAAWEHVEQQTGLQLVLRTGGVDLATLGTSAAVRDPGQQVFWAEHCRNRIARRVLAKASARGCRTRALQPDLCLRHASGPGTSSSTTPPATPAS
jgi:glycine/D-amino acid oxidase-like deaminating enzyme